MKVELTEKQVSSLRFYLYKTEGRRKEEIENWKKLLQDEKEREKIQEVAESNIEFLEDMNKDLSAVCKILNDAEEVNY